MDRLRERSEQAKACAWPLPLPDLRNSKGGLDVRDEEVFDAFKASDWIKHEPGLPQKSFLNSELTHPPVATPPFAK